MFDNALNVETGNSALCEKAEAPVNIDSLLAILDGNKSAVKSCLEEFLVSLVQSQQLMVKAIKDNMPLSLQTSAHRIKGSLVYLSAARAVELASRLEAMGRDNHMDGVEDVFSALEAEFSKIVSHINTFMEQAD